MWLLKFSPPELSSEPQACLSHTMRMCRAVRYCKWRMQESSSAVSTGKDWSSSCPVNLVALLRHFLPRGSMQPHQMTDWMQCCCLPWGAPRRTWAGGAAPQTAGAAACWSLQTCPASQSCHNSRWQNQDERCRDVRALQQDALRNCWSLSTPGEASELTIVRQR